MIIINNNNDNDLIIIYSTKLFTITNELQSLRIEAKCKLQKWIELRKPENWDDLFKMSQRQRKVFAVNVIDCAREVINKRKENYSQVTIHITVFIEFYSSSHEYY